ncbi:MAG: hypothetical protein PHO37_08925 [Kiritimatiellae bacterium]|nr:hypothetical protein [Kiritimatiellia bacterium]
MSERYLQPKDMPDNLWLSSSGTLVLPDALVNVYEKMLKKKGLYEVAKEKDSEEEGVVGGITEDDTKTHFATRFSGSAARTQLSMLDPKNELGNASNLFIKAFSGGTVGLLDIPSGAGAAAITILLTIASLREKGLLPRQRLVVKLVSGDVSEHARLYASEMLGGIIAHLEAQSIYVEEKSIEWDVCGAESTSAVLYEWMQHATNCHEYFVVMANFSGFLQSSGKLKKATPQLDEVIRWAAQRRSTVIWLEPQTNTVTKNFFPCVLKRFTDKLPRAFKKLWDETADFLKSHCTYIHPIKNYKPRVKVSLIRLEASDI